MISLTTSFAFLEALFTSFVLTLMLEIIAMVKPYYGLQICIIALFLLHGTEQDTEKREKQHMIVSGRRIWRTRIVWNERNSWHIWRIFITGPYGESTVWMLMCWAYCHGRRFVQAKSILKN